MVAKKLVFKTLSLFLNFSLELLATLNGLRDSNAWRRTRALRPDICIWAICVRREPTATTLLPLTLWLKRSSNGLTGTHLYPTN